MKQFRPMYLGAALAAALLVAGPVRAQNVVERSAETRFQLDLHVPEAALQKRLPQGWKSNVATRGPAKDANLRAIFVDRITVNGPDGKPVRSGSNQLVYLAAPVTTPDGKNAQLIIGGLTADPGDAPGPFGNYLAATTHAVTRTITSGQDSQVEAQNWLFEAAGGEHLEMHITFDPTVGTRRGGRASSYYSANDPSVHQVWNEEQVLNILRNATTNPPDRVTAFSFDASGGRWSDLFSQVKVLSWDQIPWMQRTVTQPKKALE